MKMPKLRTLLAAYAGLMLTTVPVLAHHSFSAEYDSKEVTLTGVITKVEWTNPHIYFYMDVKDASGNVANWAVEGYPPNTLKRTGFTRDDLKVGDAVMVVASQAEPSSLTVTAVTLLAGVEPILAATPSGSPTMTLSPWNVGGGAPDAGGGVQ